MHGEAKPFESRGSSHIKWLAQDFKHPVRV